MANPRTIRTALATRLESIAGLKAYRNWPALGNLNVPCVIVDVGEAEPEQTFGRGDLTRWTFPLYVLVNSAGGPEQGQDNLDPYLATSSTGGIFGAIAADRTLGGTVDTVFVKGYRDYDPQVVDDNLMYQGCIIDLEVWAADGPTVEADNMALVGSDLTERSTAATAADTELSTVTGLSIAQGVPVMVTFRYRKSAGAAAAAGFGLKINGTLILSAFGANLWPRLRNNNAVEDGFAVLWIMPGDTNYQGTITGSASSRGAPGAGNGQTDLVPFIPLSNAIPAATITSITITGDAVNASQTIYTDDMRVYTLATS